MVGWRSAIEQSPTPSNSAPSQGLGVPSLWWVHAAAVAPASELRSHQERWKGVTIFPGEARADRRVKRCGRNKSSDLQHMDGCGHEGDVYQFCRPGGSAHVGQLRARCGTRLSVQCPLHIINVQGRKSRHAGRRRGTDRARHTGKGVTVFYYDDNFARNALGSIFEGRRFTRAAKTQ